MPARIAGRVGKFLRLHRWRILVLVAVLGFFTPMLLRWSESGRGDWGYFHFLDEVARRTVRDYGQLPEWNPYHCGGNVLAANTQGHTLSPWVVFPLVLGPTAGVKVSVVLHGLLGALGMWLLLGAAGIRGPGRFLGTLLFACSGFFGLQLAVGHVWALPFYYVPFVLLFLLRGCYELRWSALAGVFWGFMILEGGVYPAPYTGVLLGGVILAMVLGWTPLAGLPRAVWWKPLVAFGACLAVFLLVGAVKLLPSLYHMAEHPRVVVEYPRIGLDTVLRGLTWRNLEGGWDRPLHHDYAFWGEYGSYIGWAGLALALGAVVLCLRRVRVLLLFLAGSIALAYGALGPGTPWDAIHRLPVFINLRVPSRFLVFAALILAWLAALAVDELSARLRERFAGRKLRRLALALPAVLALGVGADVTSFNAHAFYGGFSDPPPDADRPAAPMRQVRGSYGRMFDHVAANHGTLSCQEINAVSGSPRVTQQDREYGLVDDAEGRVRQVYWSPNEIELEVDLPRPASLWINQNFHDGWTSDVGTVEPLEHQLTVRLPAGTRRVRLVYRAPGLRTGAVLTAVGLLGVAAWFVLHRRFGGRIGNKEQGTRNKEPGTGDGGRGTGKSVAADLGFLAGALAILLVPLLIAEPGDAVWSARVREVLGAHVREGDIVQFSPYWPSRPLRPLGAIDQLHHLSSPQLEEGGWRRLWFVFCRHDGDPKRLEDYRARFVELERREVGDYTVYLFGPREPVPAVQLVEHATEARVRVVPAGGPSRRCAGVDGESAAACDPDAPDLAVRALRRTDVTDPDAEAPGRQGARSEHTRRYVSDEQRSRPGWIGAPNVTDVLRRALRAVRQKSGGQLRRCVLVPAMPGGSAVEVTFPGLLARVESSFVLHYGFADSPGGRSERCGAIVTLSAGSRRLDRFDVPCETGWKSAEVLLPEDADADLVLRVSGDGPDVPDLCIGAVLRPVEGAE